MGAAATDRAVLGNQRRAGVRTAYLLKCIPRALRDGAFRMLKTAHIWLVSIGTYAAIVCTGREATPTHSFFQWSPRGSRVWNLEALEGPRGRGREVEGVLAGLFLAIEGGSRQNLPVLGPPVRLSAQEWAADDDQARSCFAGLVRPSMRAWPKWGTSAPTDRLVSMRCA